MIYLSVAKTGMQDGKGEKVRPADMENTIGSLQGLLMHGLINHSCRQCICNTSKSHETIVMSHLHFHPGTSHWQHHTSHISLLSNWSCILSVVNSMIWHSQTRLQTWGPCIALPCHLICLHNCQNVFILYTLLASDKHKQLFNFCLCLRGL